MSATEKKYFDALERNDLSTVNAYITRVRKLAQEKIGDCGELGQDLSYKLMNDLFNEVSNNISLTTILQSSDIHEPVRLENIYETHESTLTGSAATKLFIGFDIPKDVHFIEDISFTIRLSEGISTQAWRYFSLFPHKLVKKVRLKCQNPQISLCEYDGELYNVFYETKLDGTKQSAYDKCIGQMQYNMLEFQLPTGNSTIFPTATGLQTLKTTHKSHSFTLPVLFKPFLNRYNLGRISSKLLGETTLKFVLEVELEDISKVIFPETTVFTTAPKYADAFVNCIYNKIDKNLYNILSCQSVDNNISVSVKHSFLRRVVNKIDRTTFRIDNLEGSRIALSAIYVIVRDVQNTDSPDFWYKGFDFQKVAVSKVVGDDTTTSVVVAQDWQENTSKMIETIELSTDSKKIIDSKNSTYFNSYAKLLQNTKSLTNDMNWYCINYNNEAGLSDNFLPIRHYTDTLKLDITLNKDLSGQDYEVTVIVEGI